LEKNLVAGLDKIPVYIDSPLGIEGTRVYERCAKGYYDEEASREAANGSPFDFPTLRIAQTAEESKRINELKESKIIISSSGMCEAGRIRHHLKHNLYRADSTVLFVGYQAVGTLGNMLLNGVKKVKLFGEDVRVNAAIERIEGFSGHAGRDELIEWLRAIETKPRKVFLVHGESAVLNAFAHSIRSLGYDVSVPKLGESYDIFAEQMEKAAAPAAPAAGGERLPDIAAQLERIESLLMRADENRGADTELKLRILEEDIRALADKWERLL
jgi:metallo-beta-lactamase family protein